MNCETFRESIALALYGELSPGERRDLDAHLAAALAHADARAGVEGAVPFLIPYVSKTEDDRVARMALVALVGEDFGENVAEWKAWWRSMTN